MFRFQNPEYLYLLILLLGLVVLFIYAKIRQQKEIERFGAPETVKKMSPDYSSRRANTKFWLMFAAIGVSIFLLARPQFGSKIDNVKRQGVEIMIALDVSNSMLSEDVAPNRLEKSKMMLGRMVEMLKDDRIGLVVFAGKAFTQLPITADFVSAKMFFSSINPSMVTEQGTAIGAAISLCQRSFTQNEKAEKAIIVITDGENHEDNAVEAAQAALAEGIKVHVVGVGSVNGGPIPMDGTMNYMKDKDGNVVVTRLNEQMCQEIAQAGSGIYVRSDNSSSALKALGKTIDGMKKSEINGSVYTAYDEQFQSIAWIVLILLIIEFVLLSRKNPLFKNIHLFQKK